MKRLAGAGIALLIATSRAAAQTVDLNALIPAGGASASGRIIEMVALLTVLSVAPGLLIMVTSFTRFIIALSFLRSGLGIQSAPANLVLISLSLFMTFFVMAPTFDRAWQTGLKPMLDNEISQQDALVAVVQPFREFMLSQVRENDVALCESPHTRLYDIGAQTRLRDRLPHRAAFSRHRHDRRDPHHVHGHDDVAALGHFAAGEDPFLRTDRRLESLDR
jgi:flagellar biosynthesis protein FliP